MPRYLSFPFYFYFLCYVLLRPHIPPPMLCVYLQTFEAALFWKKKKRRSCEIRFSMLSALSTQLGESIGSTRSSSRRLFMEGAVDGCGEERVACSWNRQRRHSHERRPEDSAFLRRAQARWRKRPHDAQ